MAFDTFVDNQDLEFGSIHITKNVKNMISFISKNKTKLKRLFFAFVIVIVGVMIRLSYDNVENIQQTFVTLDEEPYEPFYILDTVNPFVDKLSTVQYPIKTSLVNRGLQQLNIERVVDKINQYLEQTNNICIHARHFGTDYDIIVFKNITMINPEITKLSDNMRNIKEMHLNGETKYSKRALSLNVNYIDAKLEKQHDKELWGNQAICFQHYVI